LNKLVEVDKILQKHANRQGLQEFPSTVLRWLAPKLHCLAKINFII